MSKNAKGCFRVPATLARFPTACSLNWLSPARTAELAQRVQKPAALRRTGSHRFRVARALLPVLGQVRKKSFVGGKIERLLNQPDDFLKIINLQKEATCTQVERLRFRIRV